MKPTNQNITTLDNLIIQIDTIHHTIQNETIKSVSTNLTLRNWVIGYYIVEYEQNGEDRATYGERIITTLAKRLKHIKGMSRNNLQLFRQFYLLYPQICLTLSVKFKILLYQFISH